MRLSLGISTCPNDTYIYEALVRGLKGSPFEWDVHFADVQTLNEMVCRGELDVAKVSAQVYPQVERDYVCLGCGGAIGYGCGPLLLSSNADAFDPDETTVLPGANTTAALLFKFWHAKKYGGEPKVSYALFDEVYRGLLSGKFRQGVTIHEHRFTWKCDGLHMLQDMGEFWESQTGSPIPLGIAVARREFSPLTIADIESEIKNSLREARSRQFLVTDFIREKAQIDDENVIESHIRMFVNDFSEGVGEAGRKALDFLWSLKKC